jgi:type IV secretion system protein VirB5
MKLWRQRSRNTPAAVPLTPWQQAENRWERWRRDPERRAHWWKVTCLLSWLSNSILGVGFIAVALQAKVVPYLVEVSETGAVRKIGVVERAPYKPSEELLKRITQEFVENTRNVPRDALVLGRNWERAKAVATVPVQQMLKTYAEAANLKELLEKNIAVLATVETVLPQSERTFQVEWVETVTGYTESKAAYRGVFELVVKPPGNQAELERNPLGIYIAWFQWAKRGSNEKG